MKDQLITFETAKLAKEKGFANNINEQVFGIYDELNGNEYKRYYSYNSDETKITSSRISAPTQSLLQKWLREVHEINIGMDIEKYGCWNWSIKWSYCEKSTDYIEKDSYENVLEEALQEALKLVKQ